jgi:plasmid stabilization system protein ParE
MSGTSGYTLHPAALADLHQLWAYIAQDNPDAADRLIAELHEAMRALVRFPHRGHRRPDLSSRSLRFWAVREYLIAYAPDEHPLWIVAIVHGRRSPRTLKAALGTRE